MSTTFAINAIKYEDVRSQIVEFLKTNSEFSGQFDFTSTNISYIIDTMAYVTMLMSYQVSNTASNMFLDTTTLRKNAVSIAKTMGFRPRRSFGSKVTGTVEYYDSANIFTSDDTITIPALSRFISDGGYEFVNYEDTVLTIDPLDNKRLYAKIVLHEGLAKSYTYLGNGTPFQSFTIPSRKVDENNFNLYVKKNDNILDDGTLWHEVIESFNLIDKYSYFVEEDLNNEGYARIVFGDNDISYYPSNEEIVTVRYIETNSVVANGNKIIKMVTSNFEPSTTMKTKGYTENNFINISTTTGTSYGAKDIETLDEIKERCPKAFATVGRAVTENDYKTQLQRIGGVYKSNAIGGDILYPNNDTKLGNIYLTAIPSLESVSNIFTANSIYLSTIQESDILTKLNTYRIAGTQLNFLKPSYVYVSLNPVIEVKPNTTQSELDLIKTSIKNTLGLYFASNFTDFAPTFRSTKVNGLLSDISGIISSQFTTDMYFALCKDSFYDSTNYVNNMIYLPVIVKSRDQYGNITQYDNFVKTNVEQKVLLNKTELLTSERTITGAISNLNNDRVIYNEDIILETGDVENCDLYIDGTNVFFNMYRFETDLTKNTLINLKPFTIDNEYSTLIVTPSVTSIDGLDYDSYVLNIKENVLGTIKRTNNRSYGFKGIADKEGDITSTTNGSFYEIVNTFPITGTDKTFTIANKGDVIIYNAAITGDKWVKCTEKGTISATDDTALFDLIKQNSVYLINTDGNFDGRTPNVSAGDYIIFNTNSSNIYNWDVLNLRNNPTDYFDASTPFVKEVSDYEIKRITNTYLSQTNFGGRTNDFSEDDLIYYDPIETIEMDRWKLICNVSLSGSINMLPTIDALPISGGSLEIFNYDPVSGIALGTAYRVVNIGDFGSSKDRVIFPTIDDVAFDNDVLIYVGGAIGEEKWKIWQDSQPSIFNIDGTIDSALPMKLTYADMFVISISGDFSGSGHTYGVDDFVVYIGNNSWIPLTISSPTDGLNATSKDNLPKEANIGDIFTVVQDGTFNNSYMIAPINDTFVAGDRIIYNGTNYTKLNEYTFVYNYNAPRYSQFYSSKDYLNDLFLNSVFKYKYNYDTKYYTMYFEDFFHGKKIGTFRYKGISTNTLYDIGKILFEPFVYGSYNYQDITGQVNLSVLFDEKTVNKIKFLAKNKIDLLGNVTTIAEDNFDTNFNTFVIVETTEPKVKV